MQRMLHRCMSSLSAVVFVILSLFGVIGVYGQKTDRWQNTKYNTTEGTEFWVTFMSNSGAAQGDVDAMNLYLYATSNDKEATVTITYYNGTSEQFTVAANEQKEYPVKNEYAYINNSEGNQTTQRGVKITSSQPISLYATNKHTSGKYDATNILPTKALYNEYIVQTYRADEYATEFAVVATQNNQRVKIKIKKTTIDQPKYNNNIIDTITNECKEYDLPELTLNAGETYMFRSTEKNNGNDLIKVTTSLAGSTICSNAPLALFIGGQSVKIPSDPENHIFSQAYPTDKWGKTFIITPTYYMVYDYVQFSACLDNTRIYRDGVYIATINKSKNYIDTIKSDLYYSTANDYIKNKVTYKPNIVTYTTDKITECFLYATSQSANHPSYNGIELNGLNKDEDGEVVANITFDNGAPALTPIIPQEYGMNQTRFATFTQTNTELKHYVNIVTLTSEVGGMRLDNNDDIVSEFKTIEKNPNYSYVIKEVTNTSHCIKNINSGINSTFTARVYGLGKNAKSQEAYAYAAGSRVSRSSDVLVNGEYIDEKTICINQSLDFKGIVEGDYESVAWDFKDSWSSTNTNTLNTTHTFTKAGTYDIEFIVNRPYPYICQSDYYNSGVQDRVYVRIKVIDNEIEYFTKKICKGMSVTLKGLEYNNTGELVERSYTFTTTTQETKHFFTEEGCNRTVYVNVEVGEPETKDIYETACEQYIWYGTRYTESGDYEHSYNNEYGCTSKEVLHLTILKPATLEPETVTICANSSYYWNGRTYSQEGTYTAQPSTPEGCYNNATLVLKIEKNYREEIPIKLCYGESYEWRGQTYTTAGRYTSISQSPTGCDSTFILNLSYYNDYTNIEKNEEICKGGRYWFYNEYLTQAGDYTKNLTSKVGGCDSIVTIHLIVHEIKSDTIYKTICQGESYYFNGRNISADGSYRQLRKNEHGCTDTTTLILTVNPITHSYDTIRTCERDLPVTYAGKQFNNAGDEIVVLQGQNRFGCDSVCHLHLIVDKAIITLIDVVWCDYYGAYNHPDNRTTSLHNLTSSGKYEHTLTAANGCDSIIRLNLTIASRSYKNLNYNVCDNQLPFIYQRTNLELYQDTTFQDTIENGNSLGCDSVITITFKVYPTRLYEEYDTICQGGFYEWSGHESHRVYDVDRGMYISARQIPTDTEAYKTYTYIDSLKNRTCSTCDNGKGCDSIFILHLRIDSTYNFYEDKTISDEQAYKWQHTVYIGNKVNADTLSQSWFDAEGERDIVVIPANSIINDFTAEYKTFKECDSIYHLHLLVGPTFRDTVVRYTCENEPYSWYHTKQEEQLNKQALPDRELLLPGLYYDSLKTQRFGFDSIYVLDLRNNPTYLLRDSDTICSTVGNYKWYGHESPFIYSVNDNKRINSNSISLAQAGTFVYIDSLTTTDYKKGEGQVLNTGCDSICYLHLVIHPSYSQYDTITMCANSQRVWQDSVIAGNLMRDEDIESPVRAIVEANEQGYDYVVTYPTIFRCDSTFHLHLIVNPADTTAAQIDSFSICDNETYFFDDGITYNANSEWVVSSHTEGDNRIGEYELNYLRRTYKGCDSAITHIVKVYPTYKLLQDTVLCQDTIDSQRNWYDLHGNIRTKRLNIARSVKDTTYTDTLYSINGCDSIFYLHLTVKPSYKITEKDTICATERYNWHDRLYCGEEYGWGYEQLKGNRDDEHRDSIYYHYPEDERVISVGLFTDSIVGKTSEGCDSTYYLQLLVLPAKQHIEEVHICYKDTPYLLYNEDILGEYSKMIFFSPKTSTLDSLRKDTLYSEYTDTLISSYGCDSIVHYHITVHPTYEYVSYASICWDSLFFWRDTNAICGLEKIDSIRYRQTGIYYNNCYTDKWLCDSTYILDLYVKPIVQIDKYIDWCDDTPLYHSDTLWYDKNHIRFSTRETMLWQPEMDIPNPLIPRLVRYKSEDGCDTIIYNYYISIHQTYDSLSTTDVLCSNSTFPLHDNLEVGQNIEYSPGKYILPIDTTFTDTLHTIHGCDSVFRLQATIYPAYRHIDYDTICSNETHTWRQHQCSFSTTPSPNSDDDSPYNKPLYFHNIGDTAYYDIYETDHGCDSIYELRLHIKPAYEYTLSPTLCFDEMPYKNGKITVSTSQLDTYDFHQRLWTYTDNYHFYTTENCDSIIHLSLTVYDTTSTHLIDTICAYQRYYPFEYDPLALNQDRSVYHDTSGFYIDSTLNIHGCKHAVFTHLTVIPPTNFTLELPPLCADEKTLEISYQYTGRPIEEFSVIFDSLARAQGFENISHAPITDLKNQIVEIPVPYGDTLPMPNPPYFETWSGYPAYVKEPKRQYVRPGKYAMKIILHNGLCDDEFQTKDTVLNILYPSWIHEQHWNDGIVLFNEIYNGGYTFSDYQWYLNDEPIIGQKREYLYWPDSLALNYKDDINGSNCTNEYRLLLTREDDGVAQFTCPICPIRIYDHIVPKKDYFAVVPTLVVKDNPCVWILSSRPGKYWFYSNMSILAIPPTHFEPNDNNYVDKVCLPVATPGIYLMVIQTDDGEMRTFKIMIVDEN